MKNLENTQALRKIFEIGYEYLVNKCKVSKDELDKELKPVPQKNNINDIFEMFTKSAMNRNMMLKVIGSKIMPNEVWNREWYYLVEKFDISNFNKRYQKLDDFIDSFKGKYNNHDINFEAKGLFPQYLQAVYEGAKFLSKFTDSKSFYDWCDELIKTKGIVEKDILIILPLFISARIKGIGFALACDFLKEIGLSDYGKPDVHLIEIFFELDLISSKNPIETFDIIQEIAFTTNKSPFTVDKLFWIIGSGKITNRTNISNRKKFIKYFEENQKWQLK